MTNDQPRKIQTIMNKIKYIIGLLGLAFLLPVGAFAAGELQYEAHTLYTVPSAFPTGTASNIAAQVTTEIVNATKQSEFVLELVTTPNATGAQGANNISVRYSISANGTDWPAAVDAVGQSGWFNIPLTNNTSTIVWSTNIVLNSAGYWRLDYLTNGHSGSLTNGTIKAWFKPQRSGNQE